MPKRQRPRDKAGRRHESPETVAVPPAAFTTAYEADLLRGTPPRTEWIKWAGDDTQDIWADRYDVVHLLEHLPERRLPRVTSAASLSSSWSLPSDVEERYQLSSDEEVEDYARSRRQIWVDGLREARLRERDREDAEEIAKQAAAKEMAETHKPPPDVLNLMEHTARSLAASPNPAALETRIMARHSKDARFAFLRSGGRWSREWALQRSAAMRAAPGSSQSRTAPAPGTPSVPVGVSALVAGYDSEESVDSDDCRHSCTPPPLEPDGSPPPPPPASP